MIVEQTLLTDHVNLSNREFRKKYAEGLKIIEISDGFEKSKPSFETSSTGKYIAIKSDENKYLVFYSKGTNIISENYSVISVFDLDQEISKDKIYEHWIVEKPALFTLYNDGTWSMNEKGTINLDGKKEVKVSIDSKSSKKEPKPITQTKKPLLIEQKDKEIVKKELLEVIEIKEDNYIKSKQNIENLVIVKKKSDESNIENKFEAFMNKKNELPRFLPYLLALIVPFLLVVLIFSFSYTSKVSNTNSNETIKPDPITIPIESFTPKATATPVEIKPTPSPSPSLVPTIKPTQSPKPKKIVKSKQVIKKSPVIVKVKPKNILKPSSTQLNTINKEKLMKAKKLKELEKQIKLEKLKELERKIKEEKAKE